MQHVFLIGTSGSEKQTVSHILAQRLGRPLLDVDALVEEESGERIQAILARHGEGYFRDLEYRVLKRAIATEQSAIIAADTGIVESADNRNLMVERGIAVYLRDESPGVTDHVQMLQKAAPISGIISPVQPMFASSDALTVFYCSTRDKSAEHIAHEIIATLVGAGSIQGMTPTTRPVRAGQGYDVVVDWGGLGRLAHYLSQLALPPRIFLVTDSNLYRLYAPTMLPRLSQAGFEVIAYCVPPGEASKSQQQLSALYDWLLEHKAERREAIVALGGGVVGDLTGYAAATYLRGVPLVQVPTSLLAQVDSAIGAKTGINHPRGKNLIGAFYHPRLVLCDPAALLTLPVRERTEGWAEIVKYGMILDAELFALLEAHTASLRAFSPPPGELLSQIIARCIDLKVAVIEEDEREQGQRAILNYGHTLAHALENVSGYGEWLHGEAVSLGMVAVARIAEEAGLFSSEDRRRQNTLLAALGLPVVYQGAIDVQAILAKIQLDKKVMGKRVRWIVPRSISEVEIMYLPDDLVERVVTAFFAGAEV
jgi:shikimate kinase/3-dehydroquinate synthase